VHRLHREAQLLNPLTHPSTMPTRSATVQMEFREGGFDTRGFGGYMDGELVREIINKHI
jgi:hypothetical protein